MSQNQDYSTFNHSDEQTGERERTEEDQTMETQSEQSESVFRKLSNSLSIKEKVELTVKLHNDNYYLGKSMEELKDIDKRIRPLKTVTTKHYHSIKSTRALNKKLSWVMSRENHEKPFTQKFIYDLENNKFTSVIKALHAARDIFIKENPDEYNVKQATHSIQEVEGVKQRVVAKREVHAQATTANDINQPQLQQFIDKAKEKLRENSTIEMINAHSSKRANQRLLEINSNSPSIIFAKQVAGCDASSAEKKLSLTTIALVHDILESIGLED